jgi:hypothetical protein
MLLPQGGHDIQEPPMTLAQSQVHRIDQLG